MNFEWYQIINPKNTDKEIQQGDLVEKCPIIIPPKNMSNENPEVDVSKINSIVLTQSCDLDHKKVDIVLVCPYYNLDNFLKNQKDCVNQKSKRKKIKELKNGNLPSYHLLNKDKVISIEDYLVVDFRNVFGIHFIALKEIIRNLKERKRLLPPYREHLSQAFARYFMRVGLPQDIVVEGY